MNCSPTLTAEEFGRIHNALIDLDHVDQQLSGIVSHSLMRHLGKGIAEIRGALAKAYALDDHEFKRKSALYAELGRKFNFDTVWSIYELESLEDFSLVPFPAALWLDHGQANLFPLPMTATWMDLWASADAVIKRHDPGHPFVEGFMPTDDPKVIRLQVGS